MNNIKTKVISISVAVIMFLFMAVLSISAVNAAEIEETTGSEIVETTGVVQSTDAVSSTADSATPDSSADSANGFIATGGSALMFAAAAGVIMISGAVFTVANRRRETL